MDSERTRAAANSMASGIPSSRRQIDASVAVFWSVIWKSGLASWARALNSCTASKGTTAAGVSACFGSGSDRDGTRYACSPPMRSASRLLASIVTCGH